MIIWSILTKFSRENNFFSCDTRAEMFFSWEDVHHPPNSHVHQQAEIVFPEGRVSARVISNRQLFLSVNDNHDGGE